MSRLGKKTNTRLGEENINNQGMKMKIIDYRRCDDIDVMFEDGYISYNKRYDNFKAGMIKNINLPNTQIINRIGETKYNKNGSKMTIIEYNNASDIIVEFEDGYKTNSCYGNFKKENILSPYDKTVCGIGYLGEGKYKPNTLQYKYWHSMIQRCYDKKFKEKYPTYKDVICCEEWHSFQNFAKWFDENYYEVEGEIMNLDKDILIKNNKIYSPNTCCFVPHRINSLFVKRNKDRGNYPIGVFFSTTRNKFIAKCSITNSKGYKHLGYFNTLEEAFESYKTFKEKYIKQVADEYKDKIPKKLYEAMYRYKVEITD